MKNRFPWFIKTVWMSKEEIEDRLKNNHPWGWTESMSDEDLYDWIESIFAVESWNQMSGAYNELKRRYEKLKES